MGAFNTVSLKRLLPCERCGDEGFIEVQFKYGDTQQHHYQMGDKILWGGNDIGTPNKGEVALLGTPEYCGVCGLPVPEEYVLLVINGYLGTYRLASPDDIAQLP